MRFYVITVLPEILRSFAECGLVGKAIESGRIHLETISPREFATDRHRSVDDAPYGGGSGMVMMPGPLVQALQAAEARAGMRPLRVLLTPQGEPFTQAIAREWSALPALTLLCGRYEGVDERVRRRCDREVSLGDFVLMGGEVAAMAVIEAVARLLPGVLGNPDSIADESHARGRLEYPQYTRPAVFCGEAVPEVLLSGNHAEVRRWRTRESLRRTLRRRPDLLERFPPDAEERAILEDLRRTEERGAPLYCALVHYPVRDREGNAVTSTITNVDVHDLARTARTYGVRGYFVVSPISAQRLLVDRILEHWRSGAGARRVPERTTALAICRPIESVQAAAEAVAAETGTRPEIWVTAARPPAGCALTDWHEARARLASATRAVLLLFGTAHGLHESLFERADVTLAPIQAGSDFRHLSVRAAAAIALDRLCGDR